MATSLDKHGSSKTLFIRNLPFDATDSQLEHVFNEIGPIQRCFVVRTKGEEKCKGYGYVKFSLLEDAIKAQNGKLFLNGRKLLIHSADKKKKPEKKPGRKRKKETLDSDDDDDDDDEGVDNKKTKESEERKRSNQEKKYLRSITLVVTGIPKDAPQAQVAELVTEVKSFSKIIYPVQDSGEAHLRFKSIRDTKRAERKLNNKKIKGITLRAVQLSEHQKRPRDVKRCRLIIRNLSFKCKADNLEKIFSKFGKVVEVNIPTKEDGKMKGFAFVQLNDLVEADAAVKAMNGQNILGRPVAVDWALSIDHYKQALHRQQQQNNKEDEKNDDSDDVKDDDEGNGESDDDVVMSDEKSDKSDNEDDDEEDESESEGSDDEEEDSDDEGFDDNDKEKSDDDTDEEKDDKSKSKKERQSDVEQGKTIFMRNVSFDTTEAKLTEVLSQYGDLKYCKLVKDPVSSHSKGTAFAQFVSSEMAKNCIQEASKEPEDKGILVDGRKLLITLAVDRKRAEEYRQKEDKKEKKDKRNLYLIREGYIRPGTEAAKTLEKTDINKRLRIEAVKRQKLKNPSVFVSATRLCVHNLPTTLDDQKLRKLFTKVVNDKSSKITECRVMRDLNRVNAQGVAKSRGYAFIEFTKHEHALKALRETNNNPELLGDKKRLIVEFSLENKQALVAKQKRLERQKAKQESLKKSKETQDGGKDFRQRNRNTEKPNKIKQNLQNNEKESKIAKKLYSGPVGFPKHFGPKVRHKARPSVVQDNKSKNITRKPHPQDSTGQKRKSTEKDTTRKRKRQKAEIRDNFDQLINKYKQKLMSEKSQASRNKWFD
ncbi:RNA-binding protein 28 isoform X1 [Patella vulgata]|uniref:RNA-binding protein 28 isoform X1 n=1 Tax=Patella vulgata TaxID=6465 RepID=UPI00217F385F|nr:RNA-binding protein 28 isoform X1 [Patella vulgata]